MDSKIKDSDGAIDAPIAPAADGYGLPAVTPIRIARFSVENPFTSSAKFSKGETSCQFPDDSGGIIFY
jgi:hypothetical protein